MLDFGQWLEVEKVVAKEKSIEEILKDCWDYSAKKTKEDDEKSIKEWYKNEVEYLNMENGELEDEVDELSYKAEKLEQKLSSVETKARELLKYCEENHIDESVKTQIESIIKDIK